MQSQLARAGVAVFAMLFAIAILTERPAAGEALVAGESSVELPATHEIAHVTLSRDTPVAVAGVEVGPAAAAEPATPEPAAPITAPGRTVSSDGIVLASWYGPGFYGNRTACGQTFTAQILGVAHRTLPCGTQLTLTYGGRSVTVPVIDRGPYVAGRTLDLSSATKIALGCTDLCTLRMQILQ